ncbi:MAG: sigma-70 family RNA polymerase sigma factor, partial [Bacteroidota bacterium]|nr:sigma-70 family RNA polymerase sigma factor [Bacteroidota bacterium]
MEAEDFLHEGFLKIFDNIGQFESKGSIEGWLRRVMVNNILESYRKNSKYSFVDDSDINLAERYDDTEEDDGIEVSMSELHALIEQLPDRYKLVFKLYVLEQFSHEDIAKSLNISVGTSKSNLARARQWLQKRIDKKKAEKERALWQI